MVSEYKKIRPDIGVDNLLNRLEFCEILALLCKIKHLKEGGDPKAIHARTRVMFLKEIIPFVNTRYDEDEYYSLTYFRDKHVWQEEINDMLETNMEGIMNIFTTYMEPLPDGFTNMSAFRMLKAI